LVIILLSYENPLRMLCNTTRRRWSVACPTLNITTPSASGRLRRALCLFLEPAWCRIQLRRAN